MAKSRLEKEAEKPETIARMKFIRDQVEKTVLPYRENTEAAVVAAACLQVARTLLDLYPPAKRKQLTIGAVAFLERKDLEATTDGGIIIPKGIM